MYTKGNYFFIEKPKVEKNFTKIPNIIFDLDLDNTEKLILIYLYTNREDFRITKYLIKKNVKSDFRKINKTIEKFIELGYLIKIDTHNYKLSILPTTDNTDKDEPIADIDTNTKDNNNPTESIDDLDATTIGFNQNNPSSKASKFNEDIYTPNDNNNPSDGSPDKKNEELRDNTTPIIYDKEKEKEINKEIENYEFEYFYLDKAKENLKNDYKKIMLDKSHINEIPFPRDYINFQIFEFVIFYLKCHKYKIRHNGLANDYTKFPLDKSELYNLPDMIKRISRDSDLEKIKKLKFKKELEKV
ncbi:MAG: hypothetical protein ACOCRK_02795 [bacterium]